MQITSQNNLKKKKNIKLTEFTKLQIAISLIGNKPQKFLDPFGLIQIFKDFYMSFSENNANYNLENFPLFKNNALTVSTIDNQLNFSNNGKRFPCLVFNVNRRELPKAPIGLVYERLISQNDSLAKEVAEKIKKMAELMSQRTKILKQQPLTQEELQLKVKYQKKLENLLIELDSSGKRFCVITHEQDGKGDLTLTKIILNKKLVDILTDDPDNFILDSLKTGIPSFFGIKNVYKLYLNVFKHLTGVPLKNYGVFFNSEELQDEMVLQNCYGQLFHANCNFYNTFILTKNYHERNLIRSFLPLEENLYQKFIKPEFSLQTCHYKKINFC